MTLVWVWVGGWVGSDITGATLKVSYRGKAIRGITWGWYYSWRYHSKGRPLQYHVGFVTWECHIRGGT